VNPGASARSRQQIRTVVAAPRSRPWSRLLRAGAAAAPTYAASISHGRRPPRAWDRPRAPPPGSRRRDAQPRSPTRRRAHR
jgi:hypothetical protein